MKFTIIDGLAVFEGDIILGSVDEVQSPTPTGIVVLDQFRWPRGRVVFNIDPNLPDQQRVTDAIRHWEDNTNIRFRQRTDENDFVTFRPVDQGCSADVGRRGGEQHVNLGQDCDRGNTIHEIGHAVGLWHEQSREDRDNFITINWDNIQPDQRHNFEQHINDGDDSGPYDYGSIMHYGRFAFAIDPSQPTIIAPEPIGQRDGLSAGDIAAVNAFYPLWTENQRIQGQTSKTSPALAAFNGQLHMVHLGDSSNDIWHSVYDGHDWAENQRIQGQTSKASPALATFNAQLHMVHLGNSSNDIWYSTYDGASWTPNVRIPNQKSKTSPALAALNTELIMVHLGDSSNEIWYSVKDERWRPNVRIFNQKSKASPTLAVFNNQFHLMHLGDSSNNIWHSWRE